MQGGLTSRTAERVSVGIDRTREDRMKLVVDDKSQQATQQNVMISKTVDPPPAPTNAAPFGDASSTTEAFDEVSTLRPLALKKRSLDTATEDYDKPGCFRVRPSGCWRAIRICLALVVNALAHACVLPIDAIDRN